MNQKTLIFIIIGIIVFLGVLILSQEEAVRIKKEAEEELMLPELKIMEEEKTKAQIITLYDNYQVNPELETGWGFSCLIRRSFSEGGFVKHQNILFDTGADSKTLLFNMGKLEIKPEEIDIVVLSHIHGDHIGGIEGVLKLNSNLIVYLLQSFPDSFKEEIKKYGAEIKEVKDASEISEKVYSTGELGTWIKEQSLILETEKGLIIITGCAHPGIVNIIKEAKEIFPDENIYLVLGGFHLMGASDFQLKNIVKNFRELGVQKTAPCHCSGDRCRELFKQEYKENFIENGVGKIIGF